MSLPESFGNEAATSLSGAILAGATSLIATSSTGFPAAPFRARVSGTLTAGGTGIEYVLVTAVSGTTWTITRGVEPPYGTGLGFATGASIQHVVTVVGLWESAGWVNVRNPRFSGGAKADYLTRSTAAMTSASATLTDASGTFTVADIGKIIYVNGAAGGAGQLQTTISAFTSATSITLAATAGTTVSGATYFYATDDGPAINAALTYASTLGSASAAGSGTLTGTLQGATVYLPPGVYYHSTSIAVPSRVKLKGSSREATVLRRTADVVSISVYGTATTPDSARNYFASIEDLTVDGMDRWITGIDLVYASQFSMKDVFIYNVHNIGLDCVEVWDSAFYNVFLQFCGGIAVTEQPSVYVRSTRAASGFGSSVDTINECKFTNLHTEHFRAGAIKIGPGLAGHTNGPNGIYFLNVKTETAYISNTTPFIQIDGSTDRVHIKNVYAYAASFQDGAAVPVIENDSTGQTTIRDIYAANGGVATLTAAVNVNVSGGGMAVLDGIYGAYTTAPTVAHVNVAAAADLEISNIRTNIGTRISGWEIEAPERLDVTTANQTTTSLSAANITNCTFSNVGIGTYRVMVFGTYQSSLTTAGPRFGIGGTATTTTNVGTLTMWTSATASTVTPMTAFNTTFGTNPGTISTAFAFNLYYVLVVSVAGTVGLRWLVSAASTGTLGSGTIVTMERVK